MPGLHPLRSSKPRKNAGRVDVSCAQCGTPFTAYRSRMTNKKRVHCSPACRTASQVGADNPRWVGGPPQFTCKHCGKGFSRYVTKSRERRDGSFCSTICLYDSQRRETPPELRREWVRRRAARKRAIGKILGHHTTAEWNTLLAAHRGKCVHCGSRAHIERDHIIPLSQGGHDLISNIQPLCRHCNRVKNNRIGRCGYLL